MFPTSHISQSLISLRTDHTRRADIVQQVCQSMLVFTQPTCTCRKERLMIGVHAEPVRSTHSAMVSVSGWSLGCVQLLLTWGSQGTSSCATARCQPMPHSVMELISTSGNGELRITEDSGQFSEPLPGSSRSVTGGWPSTNERLFDI